MRDCREESPHGWPWVGKKGIILLSRTSTITLNICYAVLMGFVMPLAASAQINTSSRLLNTCVLQYERIPVQVVIENNTAEPLVIGGSNQNAILSFDIESQPGVPVPATGQPVLDKPIVMSSLDRITREINILPAYAIRKPGPYTVRLRIEWRGKWFLSSKMFLDVLPGLEIRKLVAGIPGLPNATRTYSLRTLSRDHGEHVFLRIDDENESHCYGVIDLGPIVRLYQPVLEMDSAGNIHILHQLGPRQFVYNAFTPYGYPVEHAQYTGAHNQMKFYRSSDGVVSIEGGNLHMSTGDADAVDGEVVEFEDLTN